MSDATPAWSPSLTISAPSTGSEMKFDCRFLARCQHFASIVQPNSTAVPNHQPALLPEKHFPLLIVAHLAIIGYVCHIFCTIVAVVEADDTCRWSNFVSSGNVRLRMKFYEPRQMCGEGIPSQGKGGCISSLWLMGVEVGHHCAGLAGNEATFVACFFGS